MATTSTRRSSTAPTPRTTASTFVGLEQINSKVPSLAPGDYPLVITVNGKKISGNLLPLAELKDGAVVEARLEG